MKAQNKKVTDDASVHKFQDGAKHELSRPAAEFFAALAIAGATCKQGTPADFVRKFSKAVTLTSEKAEWDPSSRKYVDMITYAAKEVVDAAINADLVAESGGAIGYIRHPRKSAAV